MRLCGWTALYGYVLKPVSALNNVEETRQARVTTCRSRSLQIATLTHQNKYQTNKWIEFRALSTVGDKFEQTAADCQPRKHSRCCLFSHRC